MNENQYTTPQVTDVAPEQLQQEVIIQAAEENTPSPVYAQPDYNIAYNAQVHYQVPVKKKSLGLKLLVVLLILVLVAGNVVSIILLSNSTKGTLAEVKVPDEYISYINSSIKFFGEDGLLLITDGDKYGFANKDGVVVIKAKFDYASEFYNGRSVVMVDDEYAVIDTDGEYVVAPGKYDSIGDSSITNYSSLYSMYNSGLLIVCKDDKYGYVDRDGELVIPCSYYGASDMSADGYAIVLTKNKKYAILTKDGDLLEDISFDTIGYYCDPICKEEDCYSEVYYDEYCYEHENTDCKWPNCEEEAKYGSGYCFDHYYALTD